MAEGLTGTEHRLYRFRACALFISLMLTFFSGCSLVDQTGLNPGEDAPLATVGKEENAPFVLAVRDELFDGSMLHVNARLTAMVAGKSPEGYLRLRGMKDGTIIEEKTVAISEIVGESTEQKLLPGTTYDTVLSLPADAISDYQLELLWGESEGSAPAVMSALVLKNLDIKKRLLCAKQPCEIAFSLTGALYNAGNVDISEAELGVGYVFIKSGRSLDLSGVIPENEELLQIRTLGLAAGGSKPFKLKLSQTVPERKDGAFMPVIRVRSYQ